MKNGKENVIYKNCPSVEFEGVQIFGTLELFPSPPLPQKHKIIVYEFFCNLQRILSISYKNFKHYFSTGILVFTISRIPDDVITRTTSSVEKNAVSTRCTWYNVMSPTHLCSSHFDTSYCLGRFTLKYQLKKLRIILFISM